MHLLYPDITLNFKSEKKLYVESIELFRNLG